MISLKTKITITVALLVALFMSAGSYAGILYFERQFKEFIFGQQFALLSSMADEVDNKVHTYHSELIAVAKQVTPEILADRRKAQKFINDREDARLMFDNGFYLFLPSGKVLAGSPNDLQMRTTDFSFREYFRKTIETKKPYISKPYFSIKRHHHPVVMLTAPLLDTRGNLVAFLGGSVDLMKDNFLGKIASAKIGKTGYFCLFNSDRQILVHPRRESILNDIVRPGTNPLFDLALEGFEGTAENVTSWGGQMVSSYKRLKSTGWYLSATFTRAEAYSSITHTKKFMLVAIPIVVLLSIMTTWLVVNWLTAPLLRFTAHVKTVAGGSGVHYQPTGINSNDEIGALADAFGQTLSELDAQKKTVQEHLHFLQVLIDTIPNPIFYKDVHGRYLGCNSAFEEHLGISRVQLIGRTVYDVAPVELAEIYHKADLELFERQGVQMYEAKVRHADGTHRTVIFYKSVFLDVDGTPAGLVGTILDITDRKRVEEALKETEDKFSKAFYNAPVLLTISDIETGVYLDVNNKFVELSGFSRDEVIGKTSLELGWLTPENRNPLVLALQEHCRVTDMELEVNSRERGRIRCIYNGEIITVAGKKRLLSIALDITERKRAEDALRELEERFHQLFAQNWDAVVLMTRENHDVVDVNQAAADLFGYSREEMTQLGCCSFMVPDDIRKFINVVPGPFETGSVQADKVTIIRKDGARVPVSIRCKLMSLKDGDVVYCSIRDISERIRLEKEMKETQARLIHTNKMTSLGMLVSGIAHEINNPNSYISVNASVLGDVWHDAAPILDRHFIEQGEFRLGGLPYAEMHKTVPRLLGGLTEGSRRISAIVAGLKDFARDNKGGPVGTFDINRTIAEAIVILGHHIRRHTNRFATELAEELPPVRGKHQQIEQVVINLIMNALQSLPDNTKGVRVTTTFEEQGSCIVLTVEDEGIGMEKEVIERAPEPFFSTRLEEGGTGLGLSISASILREHEGSLQFDSRPGHGTTVAVRIPVAEGAEWDIPAA